jgi:flagellar motility protein MotE (MotC chaperone)
MASYKNFFQAAREVKTGRSDKKKRNRPVRKVGPVPVGLVLTVAIGLFGALWALMNVERIETLVSSVDVKFLGRALAEQATSAAKSIQGTSAKKEKGASDESAKAKAAEPVAKNWTPEQVAVFNKLEDRKHGLDLKEEELQKLDEELQKQRVVLEERLKDLEKLRTKIAERLTERVGVDQNRVDKLVDIYSNMKPLTAAKIFEEIDEDLAVEILGKMKKKSMAEILNLLKADKAQRLSEKFAGYKRP